MSIKPFFSVVMPTRNRAKHLALAVGSVLAQTFVDLEVIVSDNFSEDETPQVAQSFRDERVKYFRSGKPLTIGDSYEFALSQANGEYISFLSDDDAYVPAMFERVKRVIDGEKPEIITFRPAIYYRDGDFEFDRKIAPNTLLITPFTGKLNIFESNTAMELLFQAFGLNDHQRNNDFIVSYLSNAVYHHAVFPRIKAIRDKIFAYTPADLYMAAAIIFATGKYYCLDEPLYVWHNWAENTTASPHKKGDDLRGHYEELLAGERLQFTPLKFPLHQNCCINAILQAKDDFDTRDEVKVNWAAYYVFLYDNLIALKSANMDVSSELQEFDVVLSRETEEIQQHVRTQIKSLRFTLKENLRRFPSAVRLAKSVFSTKTWDKPTFISGEKNGFDDVLGASEYLQSLLGK